MKDKIRVLLSISLVAASLAGTMPMVSAAPNFKSSITKRAVEKLTTKQYADRMQEMSADDDISDFTLGVDIKIGSNRMNVNGEERDIDDQGTTAIIENNSTYLPVRAIAEAMGCEVGWDDATKTAIITNGVTDVNITTKDNGDGSAVGIVRNNKTLAKARNVAEALGCQVYWDPVTRTASIDRDFQTKRLFFKVNGENNINKNIEDVLEMSQSNIVNDDLLFFARFESEEETKKAYDMLKPLENNGILEYVVPDKCITIEMNGTSDSGNSSWGIGSSGINNFVEENMAELEAFTKNTYDEKSKAYVEKKYVTVGVLDTGIYKDHERFEGRIENLDRDWDKETDVHGHGTHVAGIIAEATEKISSKVKINPYKVTSGDTGYLDFGDSNTTKTTDSVVYSAITTAAEECDVLNMSFTIESNTNDVKLIKEVIDTASNDALLVAAAGNDYKSFDENCMAGYIAGNNKGVVVTAIDEYGNKAEFSNYTEKSDWSSAVIAAPGVNIMSSVIGGSKSYDKKNGTSQATPHVAAAAALVMLKDNNTDPSETKNKLMNNYCETPQGWNRQYGKGILKMAAVDNKKEEELSYQWSQTEVILKKGENAAISLLKKTGNTTENVTSSAGLRSSNTSVATVDNDGRITAISVGTAIISASAIDGTEAVTIKVTDGTKTVTGYEWSETDINLSVGNQKKVVLYAVYNDGSKEDVTSSSAFNSNKESVAKISSDGTITAVGAGTAYIMLQQGDIASGGYGRVKVTVTQGGDYEYASYGSGVEITAYTGNSRYVEIPSSIDGNVVVRIGDKAFEKSDVSSVKIPSTVTEIGRQAFSYCKSLSSVTIPNSVGIIESYAFDGCSKLSGLILPNSLSVIETYTFRGCTSIKDLKIPNNVTEIKNNAFVNCNKLNVTIGANVESIGRSAFSSSDYIVIYGEKGSVAQEYAEKNGFKFFEK